MKNIIDNTGFYSAQGSSDDLTVDCDARFRRNLIATNLTASNVDVTIDSTANKLWVDVSGSDSTGDGSFLKPYRTIGKALRNLASQSLSLSSPYGVEVGAGQFSEDGLVIPSYVGVYGSGTGTTKVQAVNPSVNVFEVSGSRCRVERMTIVGLNTGSANVGINCVVPEIDYIDAPRLQNLTIRNCGIGVQASSASSVVCFDVRAWNNQVGFLSDNANQCDLYECYAYQLSDLLASGSVGAKLRATSASQYMFLYSFNSWNNETAIQALGTTVSNGGLMYGANIAFESEGTTIQCNNGAEISLADIWSTNCVNYDVEQTRATAKIKLRNALLDYTKFNLYPGGEANVYTVGVDVNSIDIFRVRGINPAFQMRNLQTDVMSGGLWRIALEPSHLCFERNTHISGAFATYSEDLVIDSTGSVSIGDLTHWNRLDVSGSIAVRDGTGNGLKFYEDVLSGSKCVTIRAPGALSTDQTWVLPTALPPSGIEYLTIDETGSLGHTATAGTGEANTASNLGAGAGVYVQKVGIDLQFKSIVAGPNVTVTTSSTTIEVSASATGEANTASNLLTDYGLYASKSGIDLRFKCLEAGPGIALSSGSNSITITASGSGEVITGSNVGTGIGIFKQKNISTLEFKSISALSSSMDDILSVSGSASDVYISRRPLRKTLFREDDFTSSTNTGVLNWLATVNGAGASIAPSTVGVDTVPGDAAGVFALTTGTNNSGNATLSTYASAMKVGTFDNTIMEWRIMLQTLSTAAQEYRVSFGWLDNPGSGDEVDGVYFEYDRATAGDFWRICTSNNSVRTKTTTSTAVANLTTFSRFRIETQRANSASFYIDDVLVGTISTNLPTGAGRMTGWGIKIVKSVGTTARLVYADYFTIMANWPDSGR
jgi:hypothetical protein